MKKKTSIALFLSLSVSFSIISGAFSVNAVECDVPSNIVRSNCDFSGDEVWTKQGDWYISEEKAYWQRNTQGYDELWQRKPVLIGSGKVFRLEYELVMENLVVDNNLDSAPDAPEDPGILTPSVGGNDGIPRTQSCNPCTETISSGPGDVLVFTASTGPLGRGSVIIDNVLLVDLCGDDICQVGEKCGQITRPSDPDCADEEPSPMNIPSGCSDDVDNDEDGLIDCFEDACCRVDYHCIDAPECDCNNNVWDPLAGETGVDCGGVCPNQDCCANGFQDIDETDVDCGGSSLCSRCASGLSCTQNSDCDTGYCSNNVCASNPVCVTDGTCNGNCGDTVNCDHGDDPDCGTPTCNDGCQNGNEVGIDCGGSCITGAEDTIEECQDGIDNDHDCAVDCEEGDICGKNNAWPCYIAPGAEDCTNGMDDADTNDNLADCKDPECLGRRCDSDIPEKKCCGTICVNVMLDNDVNNCGACGRVCDLPHVDTNICNGNVCEIGTCDTDWYDADGLDFNGCEANENTNPNYCGKILCDEPNVDVHGCVAGECTIISCDANYYDDTDASGCETHLTPPTGAAPSFEFSLVSMIAIVLFLGLLPPFNSPKR